MILLRLLSVLILLIACGCAGPISITRSADRQHIELPRLAEELRDARVIFIGEGHDNQRHHNLQLQVIDALRLRGKDLAIAAEMFTVNSQEKLDQWTAGRMDALTFEWLYSDNWSEPWPLYRDIFLYAREHRIPIVGLNYDRGLIHRVATSGIASLTETELHQLPSALSCDRQSPYTLFLKSAYDLHEKTGSFDDYCVAQTIWNRGMAGHLAGYLQAHPEKTVVVLAGSYHAVRAAIPAAMGMGTANFRILLPEGVGLDTTRTANGDFFFR
jgi:uncharacterized iron-regulated protein